MHITRRNAMALGLGGIAAAALPARLWAAKLDDAVAAYTGGATAGEGGLTLTAPEIAENGNTSIFHHGTYIGKVNIDLAGTTDDIRNTTSSSCQYIICFFKCFPHF